jgi:hypothetical protein
VHTALNKCPLVVRPINTPQLAVSVHLTILPATRKFGSIGCRDCLETACRVREQSETTILEDVKRTPRHYATRHHSLPKGQQEREAHWIDPCKPDTQPPMLTKRSKTGGGGRPTCCPLSSRSITDAFLVIVRRSDCHATHAQTNTHARQRQTSAEHFEIFQA